MEPHPVQLAVTDDLVRGRATVFFRIILAIPVFVWLLIWSIGTFFVAIAGWFVAIFTKKLPDGIHGFLCRYVRYVVHVHGYVALVTEPYPGFGGKPGYPLDVTLPDAPAEQSRARVFFRFVLALPAIAISQALGGSIGFNTSGSFNGSSSGGSHSFRFATFTGGGGALLFAVFFLAWFVGVFRARNSKGLRDAGAYAIGYTAHVLAYFLLVTEHYPLSDPAAMLGGRVEPPPVHPVHVVDNDDLRRSRLTVFFRLLLFIPHYVWLGLWGIAVAFSIFANWFVLLFRGTPAGSLHRFNSRYLRYALHVYSFLLLVANPVPGFTGLPGSYPVDLVLPDPARQNRWKTGFRLFLVIPAAIVAIALYFALYVTAVLNWFVGLFRARSPEGMHKLGVYAVRYIAQYAAYYYLITDVYPNASPLEGAEPPPEPEPTAEPQYAW